MARTGAVILLGGLTIAALADPAASQLRDDFDPARFREDLVLIQPRFTPPELLPRPAAATPGASDSLGTAWRVQVISLSREEASREIAAGLGSRLGLAVDVVPQGGLYSVVAGRFADRAGADRLRRELAALGTDFSQAFVVADSTAAPEAEAPPSAAPEELDEVEAPEAKEVETPAATEEPPPEMVRLQGWRVLIAQHTRLEDARGLRDRAAARLERQDVDLLFEEPWYKILAGSFRTSAAAQQFADRCRRLGFRSATRIQAEIVIPEEERP
ncbi:MAG: SPOR domain-containing protein [Gemmatimonadaceae bacterium]|nr:SPOR domain-containing protein [Gemmatimonadaceae bacterium]